MLEVNLDGIHGFLTVSVHGKEETVLHCVGSEEGPPRYDGLVPST